MRVANDLGQLYCTRGSHWADVDDFSLDRRAKTGRSSWCRRCTAEQRTEAVEQQRINDKFNDLRELAARKKQLPIY